VLPSADAVSAAIAALTSTARRASGDWGATGQRGQVAKLEHVFTVSAQTIILIGSNRFSRSKPWA
jgi:hypothetical protein